MDQPIIPQYPDESQELPEPKPIWKSVIASNKVLVGGVAFVIILLFATGIYRFIAPSNSKKSLTPTPLITKTPTNTPTPIVYPTSWPNVTRILTPTITQKANNTTTSPNQSSNTNTTTTTNNAPTATPTPSPTPIPTTAEIRGGYYDANTHTPLTDSMFAVAAQEGPTYARSDDKPTWTLPNLKPGHYHVTINVDFSKYNQRTIVCKNCTISNIQFASFEVDLKAGDAIQIEWLFDPK